jgi:intracellular sulfur oxidation DsrE/DsrF family protein
MRLVIASTVMSVAFGATGAAAGGWPPAVSPVIPAADGFVVIPGAAAAPDRAASYRAIFDATRAAATPGELLPALNMVGSELNALGASGVGLDRAHFVIVFHGAAMSGLLDDAHYRARFGVANPNTAVLAQLKASGVELFVCGQNVAAEKLDPRTLAPQIRIASDALIVLITYENKGYAALSF